MEEFVVVTTTFPDRATAREVCRVLLERKLAACVQYVSGVESSYWWKGKIEDAGECLCILKTSKELLPGLQETLAGMHPYDTLEIVAFVPEVLGARYRDWLKDVLT
jgi:periplasmic divalent cation tolerance protein